MKELIKEETLDIVRQMKTDGQVSQEVAEKYFPELKESEESEDERVKKAIKYGLDYVFTNNTTIYETTKEQCLAWLEKQGEENTIIVIPKFRVGDIIRPKGSTAEYTIESISGECYYGKGWGLHISCDNDYELVKQESSWSEEDEKFFKTALWHISFSISNGKSTDIHCDTTDWLKSLKDRVQPKQELNKDDETFYCRTIGLLEQHTNSDSEVKKQSALSCINWLKSVIKHEKIIKYKIGDRVRFFSHGEVFTISDIDEVNERYISTSGDSISFYEELISAKSSLNKDDIKCGDYLTTENGTVIKVHDVDESERVHYFYYASVMTEDGGDISNNFMHYCAILSDCRRATQEDIDFLEKWVAHKKYVWVENNVSPDDEEDD
jgi:hypothetical protein